MILATSSDSRDRWPNSVGIYHAKFAQDADWKHAKCQYDVSLSRVNAGQLGAVFRTVLETTRTLFVWLVSYSELWRGKLCERYVDKDPVMHVMKKSVLMHVLD